MKYLLWIIGFGLMFWALIEQTKEHPNIYVQIAAVIVFFIAMMLLMDRVPNNKDKSNDKNEK